MEPVWIQGYTCADLNGFRKGWDKFIEQKDRSVNH